MTNKDLWPLAFLLSLIFAQLSPVLLTANIYFWGDMTYYFHGWRVLMTDMLQRGQFPSWNPYNYMGAPFHGAFHPGTLAPSTIPFYGWTFPLAYKVQLLGHHLLCAFFGYLCARRLGRFPAVLAAALFSLNGFMIGGVETPSWTATINWWPALLLFSGRPLPLGLALAASLAAGHPPLWAGMVGATIVLFFLWKRPHQFFLSWAAALALALGLCAGMLIPGLEMISRSTRRLGIAIEERTAVSLKSAELPGFISPALIREFESGRKYPMGKTYYIGLGAALLALLGFRSLKRRLALGLGLYLAASLLLLLGNENPISRFIWTTCPPLHYLRSPAHYAFLPLAALILPAALALRGKKWAPWACLLCGLELLFYGRGLLPTVPQRYFSDAGPLVERLQTEPARHRYAASPLAARLLQGSGNTRQEQYFDLKHRLYGAGNIPYHLCAATGLGEPLLLAGPFSVMDFLFQLPGADKAMPYLPWIDAKYLLTKDPPSGLKSEKNLWYLTAVSSPARAWFIPDREAPYLQQNFAQITRIQNARPLAYQHLREDRFNVRGEVPSPGWIFVSDAFYPGWRAYRGSRPQEIRPAFGAFMAVYAPAGPIQLDFLYQPLSIMIGIWISLACFLGLAAFAGSKLREIT
ncbi:MAG: hypothetical protein A3J74_01575 [Elusimicrobia bacterium RIFCSPHIGHO2_02_FULL_57_9]|nr:MAG: hypothetical protein A3J74_01575 [Elusimicrobia bacterium RIFCSPHIGHO2_02_FULL_57_9]